MSAPASPVRSAIYLQLVHRLVGDCRRAGDVGHQIDRQERQADDLFGLALNATQPGPFSSVHVLHLFAFSGVRGGMKRR